MERRVVVTGMGAVTPIGNSVEDFWKGIKEGKCGIDTITRFDVSDYKVKLAAEIKDLNIEDYMDRRSAKRLDRYSQLAMIAAKEAMILSDNEPLKFSRLTAMREAEEADMKSKAQGIIENIKKIKIQKI